MEHKAMSTHQTDEDSKALPRPVVLTPEEVQQVAAAAAAALPAALPGRIRVLGIPPAEIQ